MSMSFSKSDEIIGRPGELKSQLEISHDETCGESVHLHLKKDEHVFDAVW